MLILVGAHRLACSSLSVSRLRPTIYHVIVVVGPLRSAANVDAPHRSAAQQSLRQLILCGRKTWNDCFDAERTVS
jgi:hypothetical protein